MEGASKDAVQGIWAALLIPCSLAIIGATFEESELGKAIGTWAGFRGVFRRAYWRGLSAVHAHHGRPIARDDCQAGRQR
jgi:hypothetical protein